MDAYREVQRLYAEAMMSTASGQELAAELGQTIERIGDLLPQAAPDERSSVLLMNSSLAERLAALPKESR
ncbi:hypothetical protein [Kribbella speibonae]|uniref:Uncharacterized protein n=1 Tax=Kribbella speibonae TaxID=1572660 RepID=A0A4R0JAE0_9ACTN|nr:hypothetical protein [Kribbella speibonae]TCC20241.1 hypothetical protein E0H58_29405 [Kribbella speibonae]TCC41506.1 hypothetical protein E0H92_07580 [Kribbella speibonae]